MDQSCVCVTRSTQEIGFAINRALARKSAFLCRIRQPGEIGGGAVFLASPEASYFTGKILLVDGGMTANQMSSERAG